MGFARELGLDALGRRTTMAELLSERHGNSSARVWRLVRVRAFVLGGLGLVLQGFALLMLGAGWAGAYDVSGGGCGYDGTCSDAYSLTVGALGWLVLVAVEGGAGALSARAAWRARRAAGDEADFPRLLVERAAVAVSVGCVVSWLLLVQADILGGMAGDRYRASDALQGRFFMTWDARAMAVEGLAALMAWRSIVLLRRRSAKARLSPRRNAGG